MLSTPVVALSGEGDRGLPRRSGVSVLALAIAIAMAALALSAASARATTTANLYVVPTGGATSGSCPVSDPCTLFAALQSSTATTTYSGDAVVINLTAGTYDTIIGYTIENTGGAAPTSVELLGAGSGPATTVLDGGGNAQILVIDGIDYPVTVENLTLQNGEASNGANLVASPANTGTVTLDNDVFSEGPTFSSSEIELTAGTLTINNTTVQAGSAGDGIYTTGGVLQVNDSTFTNNDVAIGVTGSGTLALVSSTLDGSSVGVYDGTSGEADVVASTISNSTYQGVSGGGVRLSDDVIANSAGEDCGGAIVDEGYNVVSDGNCGFTTTPNGNGSEEFSTSQIGLLPLAYNGGPTETDRITSSSAAFDVVPGSLFSCYSDQRGISYIQGSATHCDAGAYQVAPPTLSAASPSSAEPGASLALAGTNLLYATAEFGTGDVAGTVSAPSVTALTLAVPVLMTGSQPITVTNADGSATIAFSLAGPTITSTSLAAGAVDVPYSHAIPVAGGAGPFSWRILADSLPPGLTLSSTGTISGTPTSTFAGSITVKVTDTDGANSTATVSLSVLAPQLKIVSKSVKLARAGASVELSCSTATCSGNLTLTITTRVKVKHGHKTVEKSKTTTLANGSYTLAAGASGTGRLRLTAAGETDLKKAAKHPLQTKLRATLTGGAAATVTLKAT